MIYNRICLNVPTYKRSATKLPKMVNSALDICCSTKNLCFSFVVNKNDIETKLYIEQRFSGINGSCVPEYEIIEEDFPSCHLAKCWNLSYTQSKFNDPATCVSMIGDDMEFRTGGWDNLVLDWINYFGGTGIFFGDDCKNTHENLCVNFFTTRKYIDALKPLPFMCELIPVDDQDVVHHNTALALNRLFYIKDLKIFHNHATLDPQPLKDETWARNRSQFHITQQNRILEPEYIQKCIENIKRNLPEEFSSEISVMMTTCDRLDLLEATAKSYNESKVLPESIYIFDDFSSDPKINNILMTIPGIKLQFRNKRIGVNGSTPEALKVMFNTFGAKAVLILDSDTKFNKFWWIRINHLYRELKNDPDFGCVSLYNAGNVESVKSNRLPDIVERINVGAFGSLITKEYWEKYILPCEAKDYWGWDNDSGIAATKDGKKVYASSPSFLQHIGVYDGSHTGDYNQTSMCKDFLHNSEVTTKYYDVGLPGMNVEVNQMNPMGNSVLFCCMARYGDIIMDSFIANQLIDKGYNVYWLTIKYYRELVNYVCPKARILLDDSVDMTATWCHTITPIMKKKYPNFKYYVNAQPGSPEHHDYIIQSQLSAIEYVRMLTEHCMNDCLDPNYLKYARLIVEDKYVDLYNVDTSKPLCIISPNSISTMPVITDELLLKLVKEYSEFSTVRILVEKCPENRGGELRRNYMWGLAFIDCIYLLKKARFYVGNDSGLAWASLYNPKCEKRIYHTKGRIDKFHNYYSKLDPMAKDIVL